MNLTKNFPKKVTLVILFIVVAISAFFAGAFFAGGIACKYGIEIYYKIPGAGYIKSFFEPPFFYPDLEQDVSEIFDAKEVEHPYSFIVYGDSREIASYEKTDLISQIVSERTSFVVYLGDMVCYADAHQWELFDLFDGKIMDSHVPFYPVLGNHEYRTREELYPPNPEEQLQYYFHRFKFLNNRRWYSFTYGGSLFLILDTNTDYSPGSEQYNWLMDKLKGELSGFLFVAFHHPPYTKSVHGRKSEKLLADIFESYNDKGLTKPDIVFSGHIHNYERYEHNGIYYIVSGGGGAEPCPVNRGPDDFYNKPGDTFHYCKIKVSETEIAFEMVRLDEDTGIWAVADTFTISK